MGKTRFLIAILALSILFAGCGNGNDGVKSEETSGISGQTMLEGGAALPGVTVTLSGAGSAETSTDSTGSYRFTDIKGGHYTVCPSLTGYKFTPSLAIIFTDGGNRTLSFTAVPDPVIAINIGANDTQATISAPSITINHISGKVTLGGVALPGVIVTLSGTGSAEAITDSSSSYSFTGIANGNYTVTPSLARCTFTPVNALIACTGCSTIQSFDASIRPATAAGRGHSLAQKSNGTVWAWGNNGNGQLGDGTTTDKYTPVQITGLSGVTAIAAGDSYSMALKCDGTVWAWGNNGNGQLGDGTTADKYAPVQITGLSGVTAIAAGDSHSLALKSDGTVWAWGNNGNGQLGFDPSPPRPFPVQAPGLTGVTAIAAGSLHSLALKNDGTVLAWGCNHYGQIGDGTMTDRSIPVQITGIPEIIAIAGGGGHSLALTNSGGVKAWGGNDNGQLGNATTTMSSTPVDVNGLASGVIAIDAGRVHSLALTSSGGVKAWGGNDNGQLGNATTTMSSTPVDVNELASGVAAIYTGWDHSLALIISGIAKAWGVNDTGQLGDNSTTERHTPVNVNGFSAKVVVSGTSGGSWVDIWAH